MAPKKDENVRYFKVVEINGKLMEMGRYKGTIPIQAAKKAFKSICEKVGKKGSCALTFTLKETTNGSPKDVHGPYVGEKMKKKKPVVVEFKDKSGKVTKISYKYDYVVYLKKEIMKGGGELIGNSSIKGYRNSHNLSRATLYENINGIKTRINGAKLFSFLNNNKTLPSGNIKKNQAVALFNGKIQQKRNAFS